MCRLTDFTTEQLQTLLDIVVLRVVELEKSVDDMKALYIQAGAKYPAKSPSEAKKINELIDLQLWRAQIGTAIAKVKIQEEITDN